MEIIAVASVCHCFAFFLELFEYLKVEQSCLLAF